MRVVLRVVFAGAALALLGPVVRAQPGGGFMQSPGVLLRQESVQKELKLSEEQKKKAEELGEQMREKFQEAFGLEGEERAKKMRELTAENNKAVAGILKPEQLKRLKQISYQLRGSTAFTDPEVAKALRLTDEQKKDIQKINQDSFAQMREFFQGGPPDEEGRKKIAEIRKEASVKAVKVLTDKQRATWKDLQGKPFRGEIRFGPPR
jgi:hypothetical protein